jgi:hypothetical protein
VEIGHGGIKAGFNTQRTARGRRVLQLIGKFFEPDDFGGAFADIRKLLVYRSKAVHRKTLSQTAERENQRREDGFHKTLLPQGASQPFEKSASEA